jgi:hypothetical protein
MLLGRISLQYRVLSKGMEEGDEEKSLAVRDRAILLTPYDCLSDPDLVKLEYMLVWVQVHKLSERYRKQNGGNSVD